jgi:TldD protein
MMTRRNHLSIAFTLAACGFAMPAIVCAQEDKPKADNSDDVVLKALVDELGRSMTLQLEDVKSPYFVEYTATERELHRIEATCGAIVDSDRAESRRLGTSVRVGYYDLDNTNFVGGGQGGFGGRGGRGGGGGGMGGFGGMAALPLEDNYTAIRQAAWLSTDGAYKNAVETLARKQAYMEGQPQEEKRPPDFARVEPLVSIDKKVKLTIDAPAWEKHLRKISARFLDHPHVTDSQVALAASADNQYLVNSEGTRIREGQTGVAITITARAQAADGDPLLEIVTRYAQTPETLPSEDDLLKIVDDMALRLKGRLSAPRLDQYLGPVLFEGLAAPQFFEAMLAGGMTGRAEPVGGGRRRFAGVGSLDRYLNKRILPETFEVFDDPSVDQIDGLELAGHYEIDDEGVPAQRVTLVNEGKLQAMLMSRTPTSQFDKSNGHGRSLGIGGGRPQASIGNLFVRASDGVSDEELRKAFIDAVREQELEFGIRVAEVSNSARAGGGPGAPGGGRFGGGAGGGAGSAVGDPIAVFKVYPDGREEMIRGCEFGTIEVAALKNIVAAGRENVVHNTRAGGVPASVIAPPVLFEELELFEVKDEPQRLPIVPAPHQRK